MVVMFPVMEGQGREVVSRRKRDESLCLPWVHLHHMCNRHAGGGTGGLQLELETQAGDLNLGITGVELLWLRSPRWRREGGEASPKVFPMLGAQKEHQQRVRNSLYQKLEGNLGSVLPWKPRENYFTEEAAVSPIKCS